MTICIAGFKTKTGFERSNGKAIVSGKKSTDRQKRTEGAVPLHLIKLCVGIESPKMLKERQARRLEQKRASGQPAELLHITRMLPKRRDELLKGGSLYWVVNRFVQMRQRILDLRSYLDRNGSRRCAIVLDPEIVLTQSQARRPFQGWRYLKDVDAPGDLESMDGRNADDIPEEMRSKLIELGLL